MGAAAKTVNKKSDADPGIGFLYLQERREPRSWRC